MVCRSELRKGVDRMKSLTSFQELDALGEGLARDYVKQTHCWNSRCFDIEGFITDYLCLNIEYETFAEDDSSKIGFLSNGQDPLLVNRNGKIVPVIFPEDTGKGPGQPSRNSRRNSIWM